MHLQHTRRLDMVQNVLSDAAGPMQPFIVGNLSGIRHEVERQNQTAGHFPPPMRHLSMDMTYPSFLEVIIVYEISISNKKIKVVDANQP